MACRSITAFEFLKLKESTFGERIRFIREEVGKLNYKSDYTTKAISDRLGVSPQSITAIERGDSKNPSYQLIYGLSKELNFPLDALNDDFYIGEVRSFIIGHSDSNNVVSEPSSVSDSDFTYSFRFGCYVYQLYPDGSMRFIYSKDTANLVDYKTFVDVLSRFISEIEIHSRSGDLFGVSELRIPPLHHAIELFKASLEHPNAFPLFSQEAWNSYLNDFLTKNEQKEEQK